MYYNHQQNNSLLPILKPGFSIKEDANATQLGRNGGVSKFLNSSLDVGKSPGLGIRNDEKSYIQ